MRALQMSKKVTPKDLSRIQRTQVKNNGPVKKGGFVSRVQSTVDRKKK